ncbi:DUF2637 domain-containing protein [Streptomyces sp. NPDC087300]|uniref:DUF2637 domain-containing protein n=1 Tax=Streptomyces sp. NPDC087300 TaxID=3365780 RepID=UPI0037FB4C3E
MNQKGRIALVIGLVAVIIMAFRVSWNALSDVARAIGADSTAAVLYPIVVDGLMALALVATLVLTGPDRKFALRVLAAYTIASLLLNYVHGLIPALHTTSIQWGRLTDQTLANWALVLLATSLPVGSIYFGSDLVAKVLHHSPESADSAEPASARSVSDQGKPASKQMTESASGMVDEAPASGLPESSEAAPTSSSGARPSQSAAVAEPTGAAPSRATGRLTAASKPLANRIRTDAEVLKEARNLASDWSDAQLTAERLRHELRIGQKRARLVRNQLQAERTGQAELDADDGLGDEPSGGRDAAAPRHRDGVDASTGVA